MAQQVHQSLVQPQRPSGSHDQLAFHGSPGGFAGSTGANGATGSCLVSEPSIDATVQVGAITPKNGQHHRCEIFSAIAVTYWYARCTAAVFVHLPSGFLYDRAAAAAAPRSAHAVWEH